MYKKLKLLVEKILYVSRLTSVGNKKIRILFSVILSNLSVALDVLIIICFSSLLTQQIVYTNSFAIAVVEYLIESFFVLPLLVILRFLFLYYEKLNIDKLYLEVTESFKYYLMKQVFQKGNLSTGDAFYYINQVSTHVASFYRAFTVFINSTLQIIGYSLFLLFSDRQIFSIFFLGSLFLILPTKYLIKKGKHYQHLSFIDAKNVNAYIQRIIDNMFLIKILKTIKYEFENFSHDLSKSTDSQTNNIIFGSLNSILPTFSTLFILSIIFVSTSFVKKISIEFIGVLLRLFQSLSGLNNGFNLVINASVHVEELYKLDKFSPDINYKNYIVNQELKHAVKFEGVNFKYLNSEKNIFSELNIDFERNSHTLITGPNGAGKSTILGLISGLYLPSKGKIKICTNKLGYIGVTPLIIDGTIKENLLYGNNKKVDSQTMYELLEKFSFFSTKNENNLEFRISNTSLSSGQMQKISFIRALLNESSILLLDEATSNLDQNTKRLIFKILKEKEITIINSTHNKEDFQFDKELQIEFIDDSRIIRDIN